MFQLIEIKSEPCSTNSSNNSFHSDHPAAQLPQQQQPPTHHQLPPAAARPGSKQVLNASYNHHHHTTTTTHSVSSSASSRGSESPYEGVIAKGSPGGPDSGYMGSPQSSGSPIYNNAAYNDASDQVGYRKIDR